MNDQEKHASKIYLLILSIPFLLFLKIKHTVLLTFYVKKKLNYEQ